MTNSISFNPNDPHVQKMSKLFAALGWVTGVILCIAFTIFCRRLKGAFSRRQAQSSPEACKKKTPLFTIKLAELEQLPAEQREAIARRAMESEEMRRYQRIMPGIIGSIGGLLMLSLAVLNVFVWRVKSWLFILPVIGVLVVIGVTLPLKLALEVLLLKRLIKREINRQERAN